MRSVFLALGAALICGCGGSRQVVRVETIPQYEATLSSRHMKLLNEVAVAKGSTPLATLGPVVDVMAEQAEAKGFDFGWGLVNFIEAVELNATAKPSSRLESWTV